METTRPGFVRVITRSFAGFRPVCLGTRRVAGAALLVCMCTAVLAVGPQGSPAATQIPALRGAARDAAAVDLAMQAAMKRTSARAVSVALVRGPDLAYVAALGGRTGAESPANRHTVFRAASLSKPVFAYLVFTLVSEGRIDLDRPLYQYLDKPVSEFPEYVDLAGDARVQTITARLVLSHRAGLPNWRWQAKDRKLRIVSNPGERFLYSGEAYRLLQFVVEKISGQNLESLARECVFGPLGMTDTSYVWRDEFAANCAFDRGPIEKVFGPGFLSVANAAGSLLTTAADYGRFLGAVLTGKGLPTRWRDEMLRAQTSIAGERLFGPPTAAGLATGQESSPFWCLGWGGFRSAAGAARFHVGYDSPEYENYATIYPDQRIGLVVLTSGGHGPASSTPAFVRALIGDTDTPFHWMGY